MSAHGGSRLVFGIEASQMDQSAIHDNACYPMPSGTISGIGLLPSYALMQRASDSLGSILGILSFGRDFQINPAIIESLAVTVIDNARIAVGQSHDLTMQVDSFAGDLADGVIITPKMPAVKGNAGSILWIDQAVGTDRSVTSIQGNEDDILKAHRAHLLMSAPGVFAALAGVSCSVAERAA